MFRKLNCYLAGHDYTMRTEVHRVYLRCDVCGHTSQGWSLTGPDVEPQPKASTLSRFEQLFAGKRQPVKVDLR